jgi:hypothetical protein
MSSSTGGVRDSIPQRAAGSGTADSRMSTSGTQHSSSGPYPSQSVLETPHPTPRFHNFTDRVRRTSLYVEMRWGVTGSSLSEGTRHHWPEERCIKIWVNAVISRELQTERYLINLPQDFKRPHKLRAQLLAVQVPGGEPDPVTWRENRPLTAVAVGLFHVRTHSPLETSVHSFPGLLSVSKPLIHRRVLGLVRMPRC